MYHIISYHITYIILYISYHIIYIILCISYYIMYIMLYYVYHAILLHFPALLISILSHYSFVFCSFNGIYLLFWSPDLFFYFNMMSRILIFGRYQSHNFQFCLCYSHPYCHVFHVFQLILTQTRNNKFPCIILYQFQIDLPMWIEYSINLSIHQNIKLFMYNYVLIYEYIRSFIVFPPPFYAVQYL